MRESCGTCKYFQPLPFAMTNLCECKDSDYFHCECDPIHDLCKEYKEREKVTKNGFQKTNTTGN